MATFNKNSVATTTTANNHPCPLTMIVYTHHAFVGVVTQIILHDGENLIALKCCEGKTFLYAIIVHKFALCVCF